MLPVILLLLVEYIREELKGIVEDMKRQMKVNMLRRQEEEEVAEKKAQYLYFLQRLKVGLRIHLPLVCIRNTAWPLSIPPAGERVWASMLGHSLPRT